MPCARLPFSQSVYFLFPVQALCFMLCFYVESAIWRAMKDDHHAARRDILSQGHVDLGSIPNVGGESSAFACLDDLGLHQTASAALPPRPPLLPGVRRTTSASSTAAEDHPFFPGGRDANPAPPGDGRTCNLRGASTFTAAITTSPLRSTSSSAPTRDNSA